MKQLKPLACPVCHREFQPSTRHAKYCSRPCSWEGKLKPLHICATCGVGFRRAHKPLTQRYCSRICRGVALVKSRPKCLACGKPCKQMKNRYCSWACGSRQRKLEGRGVGAPAKPIGHSKIKDSGYVMVKRDDGLYHAQHRLVMEALLGRPLARHEHVHHKNGDRMDPRPANLELWQRAHPFGVRVSDIAPSVGY